MTNENVSWQDRGFKHLDLGGGELRIALIGYGRMGRAVEEVALARGHQIVARVDLGGSQGDCGLTSEALADAEVAVEFTAPEAAAKNLRGLAALGVDVVSGTTGWTGSLAEVSRAVGEAGTALLHSPNFSLGVHAFFRLARLASRLCDGMDGYAPSIQETHHRHKADSPSGTARSLAELVVGEMSSVSGWASVDAPDTVARDSLPVTASRVGENPGEHVLSLEGPEDRLELRHLALSRAGFARGAVGAAEWVRGRKGVFTMDDMLAELWR
jgi:4-hydroxy-tetrahydrodipicolinate reductase